MDNLKIYKVNNLRRCDSMPTKRTSPRKKDLELRQVGSWGPTTMGSLEEPKSWNPFDEVNEELNNDVLAYSSYWNTPKCEKSYFEAGYCNVIFVDQMDMFLGDDYRPNAPKDASEEISEIRELERQRILGERKVRNSIELVELELKGTDVFDSETEEKRRFSVLEVILLTLCL